ncbi:MAG: hypothetical protein ACYTF8_10095 [Planctomycetota bacterium]
MAWFRLLATALPSAALAATFLVTWIAPYTFGEQMVRHLLLLMLLEFIIIHSSPFMGLAVISDEPRKRKVRKLLFLGAFYSLFAAGFAAGFERWWPMFAFWGLTGNRLLAALVGPPAREADKRHIQSVWGATVLWYLLAAGATTFLPIPRFGITTAVRRTQDLPGTGLWIDEPHRVVAAGFLYFAAVAVTLAAMQWKKGRKKEALPKDVPLPESDPAELEVGEPTSR